MTCWFITSRSIEWVIENSETWFARSLESEHPALEKQMWCTVVQCIRFSFCQFTGKRKSLLAAAQQNEARRAEQSKHDTEFLVSLQTRCSVDFFWWLDMQTYDTWKWEGKSVAVHTTWECAHLRVHPADSKFVPHGMQSVWYQRPWSIGRALIVIKGSTDHVVNAATSTANARLWTHWLVLKHDSALPSQYD